MRNHHPASSVNKMKRPLTVPALLLVTVALAVVMMSPQSASAHPLGNFSINRYARLELGREQVRVVYALDMAEVPTFQEMQELDRDGDRRISEPERAAYLERRLPELASGLRLEIAGAVVALKPEFSGAALVVSEGQGGLSVLRLDAVFSGALRAAARDGNVDGWLRDTNYDNRQGWREIVVRGTATAAVRERSTRPDLSNELRSYPEDALQSPVDVREARFSFEPGVADSELGTAPAPSARAIDRSGGLEGFAKLAAREELTLAFVLFALVAAAFWGGLHALGPGHGKTVVAAYLVGTRGTARHALVLGLTVTATHTSGVYVLGLLTLTAQRFIVPERLYPVLSLTSGLIVLGMGLALFWGRLRSTRRRAAAGTAALHEHSHDHGHRHGPFGHHHHHGPAAERSHDDGAPARQTVSWRSLLALGVFGGLIPCPTAIVVLLTSISLHRVGFGMLLVFAFSLGLAAVLTAIGLALVYAGKAVAKVHIPKLVSATVPVASAAMVVLAGLLITLRAIGQA